MQTVGAEAFDRFEGDVLRFAGKRQAAVDRPSAVKHGARTALATIASQLRAGEAQPVPERLQEAGAGLGVERPGLPVHRETDVHEAISP